MWHNHDGRRVDFVPVSVVEKSALLRAEEEQERIARAVGRTVKERDSAEADLEIVASLRSRA